MTNYGSFQWKLPSIRSMQASIICHGSVGDPLLTMNVLSCSGAAGVLSRRKVSVQYTFTEYLVEPTRDRMHHKRTRQTTKKRAKTNKQERATTNFNTKRFRLRHVYVHYFIRRGYGHANLDEATDARVCGSRLRLHGSIIFFRSDVISTRVEHATS